MTQSTYLTAVVADANGTIFDLEGFAAVGMAGDQLKPLTVAETVAMPYGGELMFLPDRVPVVYDIGQGQLVEMAQNPFKPDQPLFPVAVFNSPGYVISHTVAYHERPRAGLLPLFSYGAAGWHGGQFRSAVWRVDAEPRQDLRQMPPEAVAKGVDRMRRQLPENRLRRHLEKCALQYGCPAAKNFFLGRYEAPLPTAQTCNARCLGCLSLQDTGAISASQDRIAFTPTAHEIAQVALAHIRRVKRPVVSFGQGCEGDPLLAATVIEPAIGLIRAQTGAGTINMNTNGSRPDLLNDLFDAGLESIRVSLNSVRPPCYEAYFRPRGYAFDDVLASIDLGLGRGRHVALNYLNCPGVSDSPQEFAALCAFLDRHPVHMIQWRNLNFDPLRYFKNMQQVASHGVPMGMGKVLEQLRRRFPKLVFGYFNPPKERFTHHER